ncbi:hypothetical protein FGG08_002272 [Glutinoglossum americanum]|uniref:Uncharacterized protein n=1 Tax=Glutinoglossum americanum TaxID=1670608 RepID=A0A9P8L4M0_9PEZI|nr:hypothetical protein FGG08_002272 [Glutinoglossum americanum]
MSFGRNPQSCTLFLKALAICNECIAFANSTDFVSPLEFQQYLDYCDASRTASLSASHTLTSLQTSLTTTLGSTTASLPSTVSVATAQQTGSLSSLTSSPPRTSRKWIIGAVVGPLIFIAIGAIMGWVFLRKRYKLSLTRVDSERRSGPEPNSAPEDGYKDKPMLHSDSIEPEKVGDVGVGAQEVVAELPAREGVGPELAANELRDGGRDSGG